MNKLKEIRKQQKMNQEEFAKQFNITQKTYSNYENEITQPDLKTLMEIADKYNVSVDFILGRNFNNELGYINDSEKELINAFRQLKPINQIKIIAEIKGILIAQN